MTNIQGEVAIDFETTWSNDVNIQKLGVWHYVQACTPFAVGLHGVINGEDFSYAGDIRKAPWHKLRGVLLIMHNAVFDWTVLMRCIDIGMVCPVELFGNDWLAKKEEIVWDLVLDTADLAAYLQYPRALDDVMRTLFGEALKKSARDAFKNKTAEQIQGDEDLWAETKEYVLKDAEASYRVYKELGDQWPVTERELSALNRRQCLAGVYVDLGMIECSLKALNKAEHWCTLQFPEDWYDDKKGKYVVSPKRIADSCRKLGIPAPKSTAKDNEDCERWMEEHEEQASWIPAMRHVRSINKTKKILEDWRAKRMPNGRVMLTIRYMGAYTGRYSSGGKGDAQSDKGNFQNIPRGEIVIKNSTGEVLKKNPLTHNHSAKPLDLRTTSDEVTVVNLRHHIQPEPGKKFVICDLDQIEPRVITTITGHEELRKKQEEGLCYYLAAAQVYKGYNKPESYFRKEDKAFRNYIKTFGLSLNYGVAEAMLFSAAQKAGYPLTKQEAKNDVELFRRLNKNYSCRLWRVLERAFKVDARAQKTFVLGLPSGRKIRYFLGNEVRIRQVSAKGKVLEFSGWKAKTTRQWQSFERVLWQYSDKAYGGSFFNSLIQGSARDVHAINMLATDKHIRKLGLGFVALHVHDEIAAEVNIDADPYEVSKVFGKRVDFLPKCPVSTSPLETLHYMKD